MGVLAGLVWVACGIGCAVIWSELSVFCLFGDGFICLVWLFESECFTGLGVGLACVLCLLVI